MKKPQIVYGIHPVMNMLESDAARISRLMIQADSKNPRLEQIIKHAKQQHVTLEKQKKDQLSQLANSPQHQGVVAECREQRTYHEDDLFDLLDASENPLLLILDCVQDPHNLGACLRSANAAGVTAVVTSKDKSVGLTSAVSKVASGAAEITPFIQVVNLARTIKELKQQGVWCYGAAGEADKSIYQIDFCGPAAIIMGAEGKGLRRLTRDSCDDLFAIPMHGQVSSLNVSVATGIALFEAQRQRTNS